MKFIIEQIAFNPVDPKAAKRLLKRMMDFDKWIEDTVTARGHVQTSLSRDADVNALNEANLSFGYLEPQKTEVEVLEYTVGRNWMEGRCESCISHLGMHVTEEELKLWRTFFSRERIFVAQEVNTVAHTNPFLVENGRKYNYVIFNTREILGTDIKFIVRKEKDNPNVPEAITPGV